MRISLVMAQTLDGRISRSSEAPVDWTEAEDKAHFAALTRSMGLVFMGSRTFDAMGGPLPGRRNVVFTRTPEKRVSSSADLVFTKGPIPKVLARFEAEGYGEAALIGGSMLNGAFAEAGCIHEIFVTIAPLLFGEGPTLFPGPVPMALTLLGVSPLGKNSLLAHYRVV